MKNLSRIAVIAVVLVAVAAVAALKQRRPVTGGSGAVSTAGNALGAARPRLVDLGSDICVPCKLMAPILDEIAEEQKERLEVVFINVRLEPEALSVYQVGQIPTQIFLDESGKELFRHTGFMAKEEILAKWAELGVELAATPANG